MKLIKLLAIGTVTLMCSCTSMERVKINYVEDKEPVYTVNYNYDKGLPRSEVKALANFLAAEKFNTYLVIVDDTCLITVRPDKIVTLLGYLNRSSFTVYNTNDGYQFHIPIEKEKK